MTRYVYGGTVGQITKGRYKGALIKPCHDSMDCPFFVSADGVTGVAIVYIIDDREGYEKGLTLALKDNEYKWL